MEYNSAIKSSALLIHQKLGWGSKAVSEMKEAGSKSFLYMIPFIRHLRKAKFPGQKTDQWSPRGQAPRRVWATEGYRGFFRVLKLFCAVLGRAVHGSPRLSKNCRTVRTGFPVCKIDLNLKNKTKQEENYISFSVPFHSF